MSHAKLDVHKAKIWGACSEHYAPVNVLEKTAATLPNVPPKDGGSRLLLRRTTTGFNKTETQESFAEVKGFGLIKTHTEHDVVTLVLANSDVNYI